jgi:hypothetical protein
MRGVSGEEYPIGREIFEKTYRLGSALAEPTIRNHRTVEPVGYCTLEQLVTLKRMVPSDNTIALYTAPSRREPLTGEEIAFLVARHSEFKTHFIGDEVFATTQCDGVALARAIERAHRIKGEE